MDCVKSFYLFIVLCWLWVAEPSIWVNCSSVSDLMWSMGQIYVFWGEVGRGLGWSEEKGWEETKKRLCQKAEEINTAEGTRFQFIPKQHGWILSNFQLILPFCTPELCLAINALCKEKKKPPENCQKSWRVEKRGWANDEERRLKETGSVHHSKSTNVPDETNKKRRREKRLLFYPIPLVLFTGSQRGEIERTWKRDCKTIPLSGDVWYSKGDGPWQD